MGLYDNYKLANSTGIKQYQGSVVPELVQVSQQLQGRYDAVQNEEDYLGRFMNSLQALPQDQPAFKQFSQGYRDKLKQLAGRPDKENLTRETTMLAQDLPDAYAPFAQRMKDYTEYKDQLDKDVRDGKINPETAQGMLQKSMKQDQGIQLNPDTGRYQGRFAGSNYVNDINVNEWVDKQLDKVFPTTQGYSREQVGGQWIVKQGGKTIKLEPGRIQQILHDAAGADGHFQAWMNQKQDLGTINTDYSKLDPGFLDMGQQVGTQKINGKEVPTRLYDIIKPLTDKGYSFGEAVKLYQQSKIGSDIMDQAYNYGNKYIRNDADVEQSTSANPYGLAEFEHQNRMKEKKLETFELPITVPVQQPIAGFQHSDPQALDEAMADTQKNTEAINNQVFGWRKQNVAKQTGPITDPKTRFYDKDGKDITYDARRMEDLYQQQIQQEKDLKQRQADVYKRAKYTITPELKKEAQDAYDAAMPRPDELEGLSGDDRDLVIKGAKKRAYDEKLQNSAGYKRVKDIMAQDAQNGMATVGVTRFSDKNVNEAVEKAFENHVVNLDKGDLSSGMLGAEWGSTNDYGQAGNQLKADDYSKLKGKASFAGAFIDTDGKYKMLFKVDNTNISKSSGKVTGEALMVKVPAFSGIAENMVKEGFTSQAEQYIRQSVGSIDATASKQGKLDLGEDKSVFVKRVNPAENSGINYTVDIPTNQGTVQISATDAADLTQKLVQLISNSSKKK
jgi:hypothetical protein